MQRRSLAALVALVVMVVGCQTATILSDGRVLLMAGPVAKIFDPATRTLTAIAMPATPRFLDTVTLLSDGRVLMAGGAGMAGTGSTGSPAPLSLGGLTNPQGGTALASAELFDPRTGTWTPTGDMAAGRSAHSATLLNDGHVLVAGGGEVSMGSSNENTPPPLASAELYDPGTGTFSSTGTLSSGRALQTATLLKDGHVLIAGGSDTDVLATAEVYDPDAKAFTVTGSMTSPRALHTATLLKDGHVLVIGGIAKGQSSGSGTDPSALLASADLFDPGSGTFTATAPMAAGRLLATATLLNDGKVLVVGGIDATGQPSSTAELYDPGSGTWTATIGNPVKPRAGHTASILPNGSVLLIGGDTALGQAGSSDPLANAEIYDPATGTFTALTI